MNRFLFFVCALITATTAFAGCMECADGSVCCRSGCCEAKLRADENLCPPASVDECENKAVGDACEADEGLPGHCGVTPLTPGGFCLCYLNDAKQAR